MSAKDSVKAKEVEEARYSKKRAEVDAALETLELTFRETRAAPRPRSGQYVGTAVEGYGVVVFASDGTEGDYAGKSRQSVRTDLRFHADGTVSGEGRDDRREGSYTLVGRWAGDRAAWVETYKLFETAVTATLTGEQNLELDFCSTRGVGGTAHVTLHEGPVVRAKRPLEISSR